MLNKIVTGGVIAAVGGVVTSYMQTSHAIENWQGYAALGIMTSLLFAVRMLAEKKGSFRPILSKAIAGVLYSGIFLCFLFAFGQFYDEIGETVIFVYSIFD